MSQKALEQEAVLPIQKTNTYLFTGIFFLQKRQLFKLKSWKLSTANDKRMRVDGK